MPNYQHEPIISYIIKTLLLLIITKILSVLLKAYIEQLRREHRSEIQLRGLSTSTRHENNHRTSSPHLFNRRSSSTPDNSEIEEEEEEAED